MILPVVRSAALCIAVFFATVIIGLEWGCDCFPCLPSDSPVDNPTVHQQIDFPPAESDAAFLPTGWTTFTDASDDSRGWLQSGIASLTPDDALSEVNASMMCCGYVMSRCVTGEANGSALVQYENAFGEKVLWTLSPTSSGKTLFSWGKSR